MMGGMVVNLKPGDVAQIHSYKHNHKIHRIWNKVRILYADDDLIICGNNKTRVIEATGRYWMTREPSICFFYKKYWFNIIGMLNWSILYGTKNKGGIYSHLYLITCYIII